MPDSTPVQSFVEQFDVLRGKTEAEARALFKNFHRMCTNDDFDIAAVTDDAEALERLQVLSGVRAFPMRVKCATLAWHTMAAAMAREDDVTTE